MEEIAVKGDRAKVKGINSATPIEAVSPGRHPKIIPIAVPRKVPSRLRGAEAALSPISKS
jgi:hypothetical protein